MPNCKSSPKLQVCLFPERSVWKFLVKSTESLRATAQEQTAEITELKESITGLTTNIGLIDTTMKKTAETMSDLAIAVLNHERGLGTLESGGPIPQN